MYWGLVITCSGRSRVAACAWRQKQNWQHAAVGREWWWEGMRSSLRGGTSTARQSASDGMGGCGAPAAAAGLAGKESTHGSGTGNVQYRRCGASLHLRRSEGTLRATSGGLRQPRGAPAGAAAVLALASALRAGIRRGGKRLWSSNDRVCSFNPQATTASRQLASSRSYTAHPSQHSPCRGIQGRARSRPRCNRAHRPPSWRLQEGGHRAAVRGAASAACSGLPGTSAD